MGNRIYPVDVAKEYRQAGATDLIRLKAPPRRHALMVPKETLEALVFAVVDRELIHLSGPTGTAKTSLVESLYQVPENFRHLCRALGFPYRPLKVYPIQMAIFEAPGELWQRRAIRDGATFDEPSILVKALQDASHNKGTEYPVVWLREIGRVHSASVQGGLLDLMTKGEIVLPDNLRLDVGGVAWIADSNYQAIQDSNHTLVTFDDALRRRFTVNLTLTYLTPEQEIDILRHYYMDMPSLRDGVINTREEFILRDLIPQLVRCGHVIRRHKAEGNLQSVAPPTFDAYFAAVRMAMRLPHRSPEQIARATLLGNAGAEDRKHVAAVESEVFGLEVSVEDGALPAEGLF